MKNLKEIKALKQKLFAGLFMLYELACEKCEQYKNYKKYYFVVYDKEYPASFEDELLDIFEPDSHRTIEFSLEELKPTFVKEVFTENCAEFKKFFEREFGFKFESEKG